MTDVILDRGTAAYLVSKREIEKAFSLLFLECCVKIARTMDRSIIHAYTAAFSLAREVLIDQYEFNGNCARVYVWESERKSEIERQ